MTLNTLLFAIVLVAALAFFARSASRIVGNLRLGKKDDRFGSAGVRLRRVLTIAFGQSKLLREPFAGLLHLLIFWGFVVLLSAVCESVGEGLLPGFSFSFLGPLYRPSSCSLWISSGRLSSSRSTVSIFRRLFAPPARLRVEGHAKWDAVFILALILVVMLTMFGQNAARIAGGIPAGARFIATPLAGLIPRESARTWFLRVLLGAHGGGARIPQLPSLLEAPARPDLRSQRLLLRRSRRRGLSSPSTLRMRRSPNTARRISGT